ncbi:MAG: hypothetical protein ACJAS9_003882 [Polaribacter sp.]|jgi:hypothetical protein
MSKASIYTPLIQLFSTQRALKTVEIGIKINYATLDNYYGW